MKIISSAHFYFNFQGDPKHSIAVSVALGGVGHYPGIAGIRKLLSDGIQFF